MERMKWVERKFRIDVPAGWMQNVLTRLAGTIPRIRALTAGLPEEAMVRKPDGKWSIKEHIGHLCDLEALHHGRIEDFVARKELLRAADMKNVATEKANHNTRSLTELIDEFTRLRTDFIRALRDLDDDTQNFVSTHPRLQVPMKPVDMATFTAEHDDHHLASIQDLVVSA